MRDTYIQYSDVDRYYDNFPLKVFFQNYGSPYFILDDFSTTLSILFKIFNSKLVVTSNQLSLSNARLQVQVIYGGSSYQNT